MFDPEASAARPSLRLDHVSGLVERDLAKQEEIGDLEVVRSVQGFDTAARRFGLENFLVPLLLQTRLARISHEPDTWRVGKQAPP